MPEPGLLLFRSVSGALAAERLLVSAGIAHKLVPVPRHLSSDCGFCVRFDLADRARIEALLAGAGVDLVGVHPSAAARHL